MNSNITGTNSTRVRAVFRGNGNNDVSVVSSPRPDEASTPQAALTINRGGEVQALDLSALSPTPEILTVNWGGEVQALDLSALPRNPGVLTVNRGGEVETLDLGDANRISAVIRGNGDDEVVVNPPRRESSTAPGTLTINRGGDVQTLDLGETGAQTADVSGTNSSVVRAVIGGNGENDVSVTRNTASLESRFSVSPAEFNDSEISDLTEFFANPFLVQGGIELEPEEIVEDLLGVQPTDNFQRGDGSFNFLVGGAERDILSGQGGSDTINGLGGDDIILGGEGSSGRLSGGDGSDIVIGGSGRDFITGGNDNDLLGGRSGNDLIFGGAGNDDILGGDGNDRLFGDAGDDVLLGGGGNDRLTGGAGIDTFFTVIEEGSSSFDTITDFDVNGEVLIIESASFEDASALDRISLGQTSRGVDVFDTSTNQRIATLNGAQVENLELRLNTQNPAIGAVQVEVF